MEEKRKILHQSRIQYNIRMQLLSVVCMSIGLIISLYILFNIDLSKQLLWVMSFSITSFVFGAVSILRFLWESSVMNKIMSKLEVNKLMYSTFVLSALTMLGVSLSQSGLFNFITFTVLILVYVFYYLWLKDLGRNR